MRDVNKIKEKKKYEVGGGFFKAMVMVVIIAFAGGGILGFFAGKKYSIRAEKKINFNKFNIKGNPIVKALCGKILSQSSLVADYDESLENEFIERFMNNLKTKNKEELTDDPKILLLKNKEKLMEDEIEEEAPKKYNGPVKNLDEILKDGRVVEKKRIGIDVDFNAKNPKYTLQLLALRDEDTAKKVVATFKIDGYPVYINRSVKNGMEWFRIRFGKFATKEDALKYKTFIESRIKQKVFLTPIEK